MVLAALSGDEQRIIFVQLRNPLDPGVAVAFGSTNNELWTLTVDYAKQEIKDPLKGLGSWVAWGVASFFLMGTGMVLLALGMLRALQTETGSTFTGSLSFLPYLLVLVAAVVVLAIAFFVVDRMKRGPGGKHLRQD